MRVYSVMFFQILDIASLTLFQVRGIKCSPLFADGALRTHRAY